MRRIRIKDWGIEWEISNVELLTEKSKKILEKYGFTRNKIEKTIINNKNGVYFYNDPSGNKVDQRGELNSKPFQDWRDLVQAMKGIHSELKLNENNFNIKYFNLHIHTKFEKEVDGEWVDLDKDDYQALIQFNIDHWEVLWEPFFKKFENWKNGNRLAKNIRFKIDRFIMMRDNLERSKDLTEYLQNYWVPKEYSFDEYREKFSHPSILLQKSRYIRPAMNISQLLQTKTIEWRCFHIQKINDVILQFKFVEDIIESFNKGELKVGNPFENEIPFPNIKEPILEFIEYYKNYVKEK